jgi:hypothetical protein
MICSYSITIEPTPGSKSFSWKSLCAVLSCSKTSRPPLLTQNLGQLAHFFQSAQMEGVDNRVDAGKDVAVAFVSRPVNNISVFDQFGVLKTSPSGPMRLSSSLVLSPS